MHRSTAVQPSRDAVKCVVAPKGSPRGAFPQPSALLLPSPSPGLRHCRCPALRSTGCPRSHTPLVWGRHPCHGTSLFWLQVRPRGSAGWESSLRQKPPVRLIFQAGQTRHEMKIKETNSVEPLRDLPGPPRVRVCAGPGLPWSSGDLHFCCALAKWLQTCCSLSVPQFPLWELRGVCAVACPCCELTGCFERPGMNWGERKGGEQAVHCFLRVL